MYVLRLPSQAKARSSKIWLTPIVIWPRCQTFTSQILATGAPKFTVCFVQDGITPYIAEGALDIIHETFGNSAKSHRFRQGKYFCHIGSTHSPCEFFLWCFLKQKVFLRKAGTLIELRASNIQLYCTVC
jgi:hypothetical protein